MDAVKSENSARVGWKAGYAWLVAIVLLLFSMAGPLNQFKVPPIMPVLIKAGFAPTNPGWLMSVFSILSFLLALPAGFIYQKLGFRKTGIVAILPIILGGVLGALSSGVDMMMTSRILEGIGFGFMGVVSPAVIGMWFSPERRGAPMGVWSSWVPLGSTVMMFSAPLLTSSLGWRGVWWISAIYSAVVGILYLAIVRLPSESASPHAPTVEPVGSFGHVLKNGRLWILSLAFLCFNLTLLAWSTFAPTYLNTVRDIPLGTADILCSIPLFVGVFTNPLMGVISDRLGTRKWIFVPGIAMFGILSFLTAMMGQGAFVLLVVLMGVFNGFCIGPVFAAAIDLVGDHRLGGMAMSVIGLGNYGGFIIGPILFGSIHAAGSWETAFVVCGVLSIVGAVVGLFSGVK